MYFVGKESIRIQYNLFKAKTLF